MTSPYYGTCASSSSSSAAVAEGAEEALLVVGAKVAGGHHRESVRQRAGMTVLGGLVLFSLGFVALTSVGSPGPAAGGELLWEDAQTDWSCAAFDDVSISARDCGFVDKNMCSVRCKTSTCEGLCGEACARGEGALCAFQALSDLPETCATLEALLVTQGLNVPEEVAKARAQGPPACPSDTRPPPGKFKEPRNDKGEPACDHHAWCHFCGPSDDCAALVPKAPTVFNVESGGCGVDTLNTLPATCDDRGLFSMTKAAAKPEQV